MSYVGVNIGALTVKVAAVRGDARTAQVVAHQGRPLQVLREMLAGPELADAESFGVSGQLGHITEVADGDPPHTPGGCPFQAWSVGEALRLDLIVLKQ
jgi:hypothetical protein